MPKHQMANAPGGEKAPFRLHTPFFTLSQPIKYSSSSSSSCFAHWATSVVVRQCFSAEGEGVPFIDGAVRTLAFSHLLAAGKMPRQGVREMVATFGCVAGQLSPRVGQLLLLLGPHKFA
ncbi:hypothetical protein niasHT_038247 [Heterodera trifolii]|uniref:Uncharacterized protein n=1 Tax=Heterodera trifolii TaxID=157864 RepID=A0ABD2I405_9BILA